MDSKQPQNTPTERSGTAGWLRRTMRLAVMDVGPLRRHREFRLLFIGQFVSFFGSMITSVAVPFQVYQLTHSSLAVGLLGLCAIVPILTVAFLGGALADAHDRRLLVLLTEVAYMVTSLVLVSNALLPHPRLWILYAAEVASVTCGALQRPSLDALMPRLVDRSELTAASALSSLRSTIGMIAGPAVGGVLVASTGLAVTYGIDVATYVLSLAALTLMRAVPPPPEAEPVSMNRILEGLRYAWGRPDLMGTYLVDMVAMFFGMPMALFPALATHFGGPGVLGLLYAAPAVGSLCVTATSGWTRHVHRHGLAIMLAAGAWGAAIALLGLSKSLPLALFFLACAGAADMISGLFRSTIWNQTIPDALRGRLAGIELVSYASGPTLGNLEAGTVATLFGVRASIVSGGVLCVAGIAILAIALPAFRLYDARMRNATENRAAG